MLRTHFALKIRIRPAPAGGYTVRAGTPARLVCQGWVRDLQAAREMARMWSNALRQADGAPAQIAVEETA